MQTYMQTNDNQFSANNNNNLILTNSINNQVPNKTNDKTHNVIADNNLQPAPNYNIQYKLTPEDWTNATVLSKAGKATWKNKAWFNIKPDNCLPLSVNSGAVSQWQLRTK